MNGTTISITFVSLLIVGGVVGAIIYFAKYSKNQQNQQMQPNSFEPPKLMPSPAPVQPTITDIIPLGKNNYISMDPSVYKNTIPPIVSEVAVENAGGVPGNWHDIPIQEIMKEGWKPSPNIDWKKMQTIRIFVFFKPIAQIRELDVKILGNIKQAVFIHDGKQLLHSYNVDETQQGIDFKLADNVQIDSVQRFTSHIIIEITPNNNYDFQIKIPAIKLR